MIERKFAVLVVYPLSFQVQAETKEQAKKIALKQADYYLQTSSVKPVLEDCVEIQISNKGGKK